MFLTSRNTAFWGDNLLAKLKARTGACVFPRRRGGVVARPDPKLCCLPLNLTLVFCSVPIVPCTSLTVFLVCLPFPRLLGLPAGLTLTTLPSDRAAWIRLPAGLATCRWSTRRWGSTLSSLKTRSLFWGRNTETLSDFEESSQVGEGKREGTGSSCSLFPVQICSAAEPDCAKHPNNLRWTEWQKKEKRKKKGQWKLDSWLLGLHRTAPNSPHWLLCPKTRLCTV